MKQTTKRTLAAALTISSLLAVSCMKQEVPAQSQVNENGKVTLTIEGVLDGFEESDATKADVIQTVRVGWAANDNVYVYEGSDYLGCVKTPDTITNDKVAILSGEITAPSGSTPLTFVYSNMFSGKPTVTGDNKIVVDMTSQGDKIPFVLYGIKEYSKASVSDLQVSFQFATSMLIVSATNLIPSDTISQSELSGVNTQCELTLGNGTVTVAGTTPGTIVRREKSKSSSAAGTCFIKFGVPVCGSEAKSLTVTQDGGIREKKDFTTHQFEKAVSYSVIVNTVISPLPGLFSVSKTKKVRFSKGNLWTNTTASPQTWSFEYKQYESSTAYDPSHVSHFFWETTGNYGSGASCVTPVGSFSDVVDWGVPFCEANGLAAGTWRTLTTEEWEYLLSSKGRGKGVTKFRSDVTVCGHNYCLVIAPDGNSTYIASSYDAAEWTTAEVNGFVCLPAMGQRSADTGVGDVGVRGRYWSSSVYPYVQGNSCNLWWLRDDDFDPINYNYREVGCSIRLVADAE